MRKIALSIAILLLISSTILLGARAGPANLQAETSFTFASIADAQAQTTKFTQTINQIVSLSPDFIIFSGDVENNGVVTSEIDPIIGVLKNAGLFDGTFIVRGNHDNHVTGSASLWQTYFSNNFGGSSRSLPDGANNYVGIDSNSTYLSYSFDYGNSRFIGIDVPGDANLITSAEYTFLNNRLSDAENIGLTHAFIFFHGPEYCVENVHCTCKTRTDSSCTPSAFITLINNHPIVSATFHGHEHVLGHVHMDNTRLAALTNPYEEFFTSSAAGPYSLTIYPDRIDDNYYSSSLLSFGMITVIGNDFTVSLYHTGTSSPVWSKTFTNPYRPTPTMTSTPSPTDTPTYTDTPLPTDTPTFTDTPTETPTSTDSPTPTETSTPTETPTSSATPIFADVPSDYSVTYGGIVYPLFSHIQALYEAGLTAGCSANPLSYCPDNTLTRVEAAVFMLRGMIGTSYAPPTDPGGYVFTDDWSSPAISWGQPWAEGTWDEGLTAGCQDSPLLFCPSTTVTRAEASVFGLRIENGAGYTPPAATHIFADDWSDPTISWAEPWAEQAYLDGLLPACGESSGKPLFCPGDLVTRAWAAYVVVEAKDLMAAP
jgi:hypothetical protein